MADLRNKLIRLAHQNPELREHLLPLVKVALTIGGRKLLQKVRDERKVQPIDNAPFQLSKHPIFKTQLKPYLQYLYSNEDFFDLILGGGGVNDWKIVPSSIYVDYFIDSRGLVIQINDPNNKLKAKNTESKVYWLENNRHIKFVSPSLKRTMYGYRKADQKWYPLGYRQGVEFYAEGPFKGEKHISRITDGYRMPTEATFPEVVAGGNSIWIPKGKVTAFILQPNLNEYVVTSLVNVGQSKTIQELFLGANANQVQRMTKGQLKALIEQKLNSFSGLKTNRYGWDFKNFQDGAIHIMDENRRGERLQYSNTVGLYVQTEKSEEYDLREPHDDEEEGVRWDETDAYYEFHQELDELHTYVESMLKSLFPNREIREGYSDGDDYRYFIFEISV